MNRGCFFEVSLCILTIMGLYTWSIPGCMQVTLFWTLTSTDVYFAVRGERKSGYLAVAFGRYVVHKYLMECLQMLSVLLRFQGRGHLHFSTTCLPFFLLAFSWLSRRNFKVCLTWNLIVCLLLCNCSGMLNSFAYVAWIDDKGNGHIGTYWITDKDASGIHPTAEELFNKKCERVDGVITFEFSRPLKPDCQSGQECKNVIDATSALKMVWAMGDEWSGMVCNLLSVSSFE